MRRIFIISFHNDVFFFIYSLGEKRVELRENERKTERKHLISLTSRTPVDSTPHNFQLVSIDNQITKHTRNTKQSLS